MPWSLFSPSRGKEAALEGEKNCQDYDAYSRGSANLPKIGLCLIRVCNSLKVHAKVRREKR